MTPSDTRELERFQTFLRLLDEAARAGVPRDEAAEAIYDDIWPEDRAAEVGEVG
jgi:hypothetical protein